MAVPDDTIRDTAPVANRPEAVSPDVRTTPPLKDIHPELSARSAVLALPRVVTVLLVAVTMELTAVVLIPVACRPLILALRASTETALRVRLAPPWAMPASPAAIPVSMLPPVMLIADRPRAVGPNRPLAFRARAAVPVARMLLLPVIVTWPPL